MAEASSREPVADLLDGVLDHLPEVLDQLLHVKLDDKVNLCAFASASRNIEYRSRPTLILMLLTECQDLPDV